MNFLIEYKSKPKEELIQDLVKLILQYLKVVNNKDILKVVSKHMLLILISDLAVRINTLETALEMYEGNH